MGVETTLIKTVVKYFSKNSRKMEKNGKFDVTTEFTQNWKSKIGNGKITSLSSLPIEFIKEKKFWVTSVAKYLLR